jgi:hypothetical protein
MTDKNYNDEIAEQIVQLYSTYVLNYKCSYENKIQEKQTSYVQPQM